MSVAGHDIVTESMKVRQRIGYLAEAVPLYTEHRVEEMLDFQGQLHGMARKERRARIPAVLERVGVIDRRRQLVGHLSRGLRQRVGLAVALLPNPEVLILDEPTSGLDPLQRIEVRGLIEELADDHTVLLSSHILPEIEAACPRVMIIHRGKLVADGLQEDLVRELGGASHVRLEANLGAEEGKAIELLGALDGVAEVIDRGRRADGPRFEVYSERDLCGEVGKLAASHRWVVRELSWQKATLEELFARIALELDSGARPKAEPGMEKKREEAVEA